jgi:hypothetical protein
MKIFWLKSLQGHRQKIAMILAALALSSSMEARASSPDRISAFRGEFYIHSVKVDGTAHSTSSNQELSIEPIHITSSVMVSDASATRQSPSHVLLEKSKAQINSPGVLVEAGHPVLAQALTALVIDMGGSVVASRDDAMLLLRGEARTKKSAAGFEVVTNVELIERGKITLMTWENDPSLARANRDDPESVTDLVETALIAGEARLRYAFRNAFEKLAAEGIKYRINIHRSNSINMERFAKSLSDLTRLKFLGMEQNEYGTVIRIRYSGNLTILASDMGGVLKASLPDGLTLGAVEFGKRQVITVRCVPGRGAQNTMDLC